MPAYGTDLMVGLGTALAISSRSLLSWSPAEAPARIGADFSFSLYLVHVPVTVFLGAILEWHGWPAALVAPGPAAYAAYVGLILAALAVAFAFSLVTERRTEAVRNLLLRRRAARTALPRPV